MCTHIIHDEHCICTYTFGLILIMLTMMGCAYRIKSLNVEFFTSFRILIILRTYFKSLGIVMYLHEMSTTEEFYDIVMKLQPLWLAS